MATKSFWDDFRRFFFRGLAAVLPTVLTIVIIVWVFSQIQTYFGEYINKGAAELTVRGYVWIKGITNADQVSQLRGDILSWWSKWFFWFGFFLAIIGLYVFGRFLTSFLGRLFWRITEKTLTQLPVVKQIYPSVKQVTDFLLTERKMEYSKVVAVEYPRKGVWSIGLLTNPGMRTLEEATQGDLLTVFVPSSPMPVTGYTITVKRSEVIDLPISIDEALRFTISGGVIQPLHERVGEVEFGPAKTQVLTEPRDKEIPK